MRRPEKLAGKPDVPKVHLEELNALPWIVLENGKVKIGILVTLDGRLTALVMPEAIAQQLQEILT